LSNIFKNEFINFSEYLPLLSFEIIELALEKKFEIILSHLIHVYEFVSKKNIWYPNLIFSIN